MIYNSCSEFIHYGVIACSIATSSISVGLSQGISSLAAIDAINRQPGAKNEIFRVTLIGMTLIETVAILALIVAFLLLVNSHPDTHNYYENLSEIGIGAAIAVTGFVIGLASCLPVKAACNAVARQPFFTQRILSLMLMTQVLIQTPIIFAFIISRFIQTQAADALVISDSLRLIAAGLCIGIGSIGPAIGLSIFAASAITAISRNTNTYKKLLSFTFISEAIIETPIIFCLVISLVLLFVVQKPTNNELLDGIIFLSAALCTGIGTFGPGISSGRTGAAVCTQVANNPEGYSILSRASMLAQGLIETVVIYSILLSFIMLLFKSN